MVVLKLISVQCIPEDGSELLVDPTESESGLARGSLTLACIPALGTMTGLWQRGCMSIDQSTQVCLTAGVVNSDVSGYFAVH